MFPCSKWQHWRDKAHLFVQLSLFNCILNANQASIFILKRSSSQCRWKCEFSILSEYRQKLALIQIAVFQWKVNRLPGAPIGLWFKSLPQKIIHVSRKGARSTCKMVKIGNWGVPRTCSTREITAFSWLLANFGELDHTLMDTSETVSWKSRVPAFQIQENIKNIEWNRILQKLPGVKPESHNCVPPSKQKSMVGL